MDSVVVYASRHGNTRSLAEAIAKVLGARGSVRLLSAEDAPSTLPEGTDLLVVGGPTEVHRMTKPLAAFLDRLAPKALEGTAAAAFDTRLRWPKVLSGSAASGIKSKLRKSGARVVLADESFFVAGKADQNAADVSMLEPGELERAAQWAEKVAELAAP